MKKSNLLLVLLFYVFSAQSQSWLIDGNTGTNPALQYVGTKDNKPLRFRINSIYAGEIDSAFGKTTFGYKAGFKPVSGPYATYNVAIGFKAMYSDTIGTNNTAVGAFALYSDAGGGFNGSNTAIGANSLYSNYGGRGNTGVGGATLYSNTYGIYNTATGMNALYFNTSGNLNTADGYNALYRNTTGSNNAAAGQNALGSNTTGSNNTAHGSNALYSNSSGSFNTAIGDDALFYNTAYYNTAVGSFALYANTTGSFNSAFGREALINNTTANYNSANGFRALNANTTGEANTANGFWSLPVNTTGSGNTAVGYSSLSSTRESYYNTAIGYNAGGSYNLGWNNVFLGANCSTNAAGLYNCIAIGQAVTNTAVSQARIGNAATTSIGGYANWSNISDGRIKKNMKENVPGLDFINKLKPVTYHLDLDAADKIIQPVFSKDKDGKIIQYRSPVETEARKQKEQILYTGFVAQDVEKAAKELNYDFSGVDAAKNDKDLYGLRYAEFVVPLVKAVQELSIQNTELKNQIEEQKKINEEMLERMKRLESSFVTKK